MKNQSAKTLRDVVCEIAKKHNKTKLFGQNDKWWSFRLFGLTIYCYNFEWRKQALMRHDIHHIATGYPMTMAGEIQVAAWEYAAGPYPSIFPQLFCLPLITYGAFWMPKRLWTAYKAGANSRSLYDREVSSEMLDLDISQAKTLVESENSISQKHILAKFIGLMMVAQTPIFLLLGLLMYLR